LLDRRLQLAVPDPGVQSVRVAVALCDSFAALLKGPAQVAARKQEGALIGFSGGQDGLSLRIGEAQQIYPEIWRHLDDARTAFAERGVDVGSYDRLRAEGGEQLGAAVEVEHEKHGVGKHAIHTVTKSAGFNVDGFVVHERLATRSSPLHPISTGRRSRRRRRMTRRPLRSHARRARDVGSCSAPSCW
jgi:hypothetical protein